MSFDRSVPLASKRDGAQLCYMNRIYQKERTNEATGNITWRCHQRCGGRLQTDSDENIILYPIGNNEGAFLRGQHKNDDCKVSDGDLINRQARQQVISNSASGIPNSYNLMATSLTLPSNTSSSYTSTAGYGGFPNRQAVSSAISHATLKKFPRSPKALDDICDALIPMDSPLRFTPDGTTLILQYIDPLTKVMIFATDESFKDLVSAFSVYHDGNFKTNPALYKQIYTFHAFIDGSYCTFPCLYALLPSKGQEHYDVLLSWIKNTAVSRGLTINWTQSMSDFELAPRNSISNIISAQIECLGCNFHNGQNAFKNVQKRSDLLYLYNHCVNFKRYS